MTEGVPPVSRSGPDRISLRIGEAERRILRSLVVELAAELEDPTSSGSTGSLARLYPAAFPDDEEASDDFADLVVPDLVELRRERVALVEGTLDATELDAATAEAWLGALNDIRLVLGDSLGIHGDDHEAPADEDDPDAMRHAVFAYLGWLVGAFVDALSGGLPAVPEEDEAA